MCPRDVDYFKRLLDSTDSDLLQFKSVSCVSYLCNHISMNEQYCLLLLQVAFGVFFQW